MPAAWISGNGPVLALLQDVSSAKPKEHVNHVSRLNACGQAKNARKPFGSALGQAREDAGLNARRVRFRVQEPVDVILAAQVDQPIPN